MDGERLDCCSSGADVRKWPMSAQHSVGQIRRSRRIAELARTHENSSNGPFENNERDDDTAVDPGLVSLDALRLILPSPASESPRT